VGFFHTARVNQKKGGHVLDLIEKYRQECLAICKAIESGDDITIKNKGDGHVKIQASKPKTIYNN